MSYADAPKLDARIVKWLAAGVALLGIVVLLPLPSRPSEIVHTARSPEQVAACLMDERGGGRHGITIEALDDGGVRVLVQNGRRTTLQTLTILPEGAGSVVEVRRKGGFLGTRRWKRCAP